LAQTLGAALALSLAQAVGSALLPALPMTTHAQLSPEQASPLAHHMPMRTRREQSTNWR